MLLDEHELHEYVQKIENANLLEDIDQEKALKIYIDLWNDLPEPKNKQPEQISNWIIDCIFGVYCDLKQFRPAKVWAIKGLDNDTAETGSYEYFQMGRVCYELNEFDDAMKYFDIAYQRGKKRAFQEFDKKYWAFYSENKK
ncbi:hypothetical protein [Pasteurella sp. PK-2025]|uniref:hypothetical protein n=1 Tax=Pasteurella sp. PK-2025 TaxID=3413133 RepID=UPI003C78BF7C